MLPSLSIRILTRRLSSILNHVAIPAHYLLRPLRKSLELTLVAGLLLAMTNLLVDEEVVQARLVCHWIECVVRLV
jgi:hypothetical protein